MTLQELLQQYGDKTFGGNLGVLKTDPQDFYDETGLSGSSYKSALEKAAIELEKKIGKSNLFGRLNESTGQFDRLVMPTIFNESTGQYEYSSGQNFNESTGESSPTSYFGYDDFRNAKTSIDEKFGKLKNKIQISPELYQSTLRHSQNPEDFEGQWLNPAAQIQYDPEIGAYLNKDDPYGNYGRDGYLNNQKGNFFAETFSDPMFTLPLAYAGAVASGLGAAGSGANAAAGEAVGSTAYNLGPSGGSLGFNAGGFLGGEGATPGLGFVAPSAAGWGGFGAGTLGTGLGTIGAVDYGLGAGTGNLGFNASGAFGGTSTLGGTAGSGLGIGVPQGAGWWGAGSGVAQAVPSGSLFDQLKSAYDQYGKPLSRANSALKMLGGGGQTGTGGMMQPQDSSIPLPAGGGVMQGGGGYPGFPGVMPQQNNSSEQDWFIPEYLRRGVIGR